MGRAEGHSAALAHTAASSPRRRGGPPRVWSEEAVEAALRELCAGRQTFPSTRDFTAAGLRGLYESLWERQALGYWAERLGLKRPLALRASAVGRAAPVDGRLGAMVYEAHGNSTNCAVCTRPIAAGEHYSRRTLSAHKPGRHAVLANCADAVVVAPDRPPHDA